MGDEKHTAIRRSDRQSTAKRNEHFIPIRLENDEEVSSTSSDKQDDKCNGTTPNNNALVGNTHEKSEERTISYNGIEESTESFTIPKRMLPAYNVPEKIIIVYDCAVDEVNTGFAIGNDIINPNAMLKRSLSFFLHNKHFIDTRHEYALVVINDNSVVWLKDFTNNIEVIINALNDIPDCEPEDILVLDNLFNLINEKVQIPEEKQNFNIPPSFVVRVLFTYGRSFTLPKVDESVTSIVESPYFTFDILMTHEMPCGTNNCIKIFKYLQQIDCKGFAYFFPVGRSASQLHLSIAKLLSHPLQRPLQRDADYFVNGMEV